MKQIVAPSPKSASVNLSASSLPFASIPHQSKLFLEYLRDPGSLRQYYPNATSSTADIINYVPKVLAAYSCDRRKLCESLTETNEAIGAGNQVFSNISLLGESDTVAVVTGQQTGLFTGPLYTIYKALTAIKLAEGLRSKGTKAVPVFWAATEDHDIDEVSRAFIIGPDGMLATIEYRPKDFSKNSPIGNVELDASINTVVDRLFNSIPRTEFSSGLQASIEKAWHEGALFGQAFQVELVGLLSDYGLIFVDPLAEGMKALAAPVYKNAVDKADEIVTAIRERDLQLTADGFHSQVLVDSDYFPLFWHTDGGQRVALRRVGEGKYKTRDHGREFTISELSDIARTEPRQFSPGVILRPVVQDYLFPSACYIGGAAEIAYFAQNSEAYRILNRPVTPVIARQSLTIVEAKHRRTLDKFGLALKDLFLGVDAILERVGNDQLSSDIVNLFDATESAITEKLDQLESELAELDQTLLPNLEKRRQKMLYNIRALKKKTTLAQVRKDATAERQIRETYTALLPDGQLQERILNINSFLNKYGPYFIDIVYGAIDPENKDHTILSI